MPKNLSEITIPDDLSFLITSLENQNIKVENTIAETESLEYNAFNLNINNLKIKFRTSKITPTKTGQFVTIYKRLQNGKIAPFENSDDIDFVIICSRKDENHGYFIFPKSELLKREIFTDKKEGKRAFRVYPPWDMELNKQAKKSQDWQLKYFHQITEPSLFASLFKQ